MNTTGLVSIDNKIVPLEEARIPILDRGFLFGDSIFETMVVFQDKILDTDRHLARLRRSAEMLGLELPWSNEELTFEVESLVTQLKGDKKALRLVISRGSGLGLKYSAHITAHKYALCFPASKEDPAIYENGIGLKRKIHPFARRGAVAKTSNYLPGILALQSISQAKEFHDVLWTNADNELTECTTSNIFFIGREGDLVEIATPHVNCGLLEGITRQTIIDLLTRSKIPVTERTIYVDEIPRFDEAFVCSTMRGLIPVSRIDDHKLHTARKNSVFRNFEKLFLTWVQTQLGYRVDWINGKRQP